MRGPRTRAVDGVLWGPRSGQQLCVCMGVLEKEGEGVTDDDVAICSELRALTRPLVARCVWTVVGRTRRTG